MKKLSVIVLAFIVIATTAQTVATVASLIRPTAALPASCRPGEIRGFATGGARVCNDAGDGWNRATSSTAALTAGQLPYVETGGVLAASSNALLTSAGTLTTLGTINADNVNANLRLKASGTGATDGGWWTFVDGRQYIGNWNGDRGFLIAAAGNIDQLGTGNFSTPGDLVVATAGRSVQIKTGSNACAGWATLSSGTVVVSTTCIGTLETNTGITLTPKGSSVGVLRISATTASTSFTITSTDVTSADDVYWQITKLN